MSSRPDPDETSLDEAARAGWLSYVAGLTQDEIARQLGVSRQRAQRLVSRAVAERLIHVRLEHPVAACLALEAELQDRFGLVVSRVAPGLGAGVDPLLSIAPAAATVMERYLRTPEPLVIALGTGRALRATVEALTAMDCTQHRLVSLIGNISPDGSASFYDVIMRIADKVRASHFPMPVPVVSETAAERAAFHALPPVQRVVRLARAADVAFVGVGQMGPDAPLLQDGFVSREELAETQAHGAVGEIAGWVYDSRGRYLDVGTNLRVGGVQIEPGLPRPVIGIAGGSAKAPAIRAALTARIINGLVTDEPTARLLLD